MSDESQLAPHTKLQGIQCNERVLTSSIVHGGAASIISRLDLSSSLQQQLGRLHVAAIAGAHQGGPGFYS